MLRRGQVAAECWAGLALRGLSCAFAAVMPVGRSVVLGYTALKHASACGCSRAHKCHVVQAGGKMRMVMG